MIWVHKRRAARSFAASMKKFMPTAKKKDSRPANSSTSRPANNVCGTALAYGHEGILEESPLDEILRQFDVNVFGAVAVTKAVLPGMRQRRGGHIVNITSMAGIVGLPGIAYYAGSKFALEGITEVLAKEVREFGIYVTALALGSFRTEWAGKSMIRSDRSISDYDALFAPIRRAREQKSGRQVGDPAKAAKVLLDLVEAEDPPVHLILGVEALQLVRDRTAHFLAELDAWEEVSRSTEFGNVENVG